MAKEVRRYSEAFKRQVVEELEQGKFSSAFDAQQSYGILGDRTVFRWMKKYGRDNLFPKLVRIETMKERDKKKEGAFSSGSSPRRGNAEAETGPDDRPDHSPGPFPPAALDRNRRGSPAAPGSGCHFRAGNLHSSDSLCTAGDIQLDGGG